jgi:integrase
LIDKNPWDSIKYKKVKAKTKRAFFKEEIALILKTAKTEKYRNLIKFCILTGCRRSEAVHVKWTDINNINKTLHIKGTKNTKSNRLLPIHKELEEFLNSLKDNNKEVLFDYKPNTVSQKFTIIKNKLNLKDVTFHSTRYTFASFCYMNDIPIKVLQEWMGHETVTITMDLYTQLSKQFKKQQVHKISFKL